MTVRTLRVAAKAKVNLCLMLGPQRDDGYHEVATVILPVDLADSVEIGPSGSARDEVDCPGVGGENLAARAIALFRELAGWHGPPVRLAIAKRIPVAAGMGGGSADAAAALRLLVELAGPETSALAAQVAPLLGADVPAMLDGRTVLGSGTGANLEPIPPPAACGLLVLPAEGGLSTPDVFARAAAIGARRPADELRSAAERIRSAASAGGWEMPQDLLGLNDLAAAAADLSDEVGRSLGEAREAGADVVFVTGSGPTVVGLFGGTDGAARATAAAAALAGRAPAAIACTASPGSATIEEIR